MTALKIEISTDDASTESPPAYDAAAVTRRLLDEGIDELELVGLAPLRARLRDGRVWDTMPLRTDDDATFLLEAYDALPAALAMPRPASHRAYLWDGCFEINAIILEDRVRLRVGEYRAPFSAASDEGITLSEASYRALWANIARALVAAAGMQ